MKLINCKQCNGGEFYRDNGYMVCKYCNARYAIEKEDLGIKESTIALNSDIAALLKKCRQEPKNARKYANLILDIDPDNDEALKYL
ncbi:MAG: TFIIB-type zinc finger domain-containing protein [Lachnospiraceae bacterium]|nr:TFIIB-type zinc finger domain-containing protein [Lachnospiraceae bacterium]